MKISMQQLLDICMELNRVKISFNPIQKGNQFFISITTHPEANKIDATINLLQARVCKMETDIGEEEIKNLKRWLPTNSDAYKHINVDPQVLNMQEVFAGRFRI